MESKELQVAMMKAIKELRADSERYQELQKMVRHADSDAERADILMKFAVNDERLQRLTPEDRGRLDPEAGISTVTITTIIILSPTVY